jgi:hypothetical protein
LNATCLSNPHELGIQPINPEFSHHHEVLNLRGALPRNSEGLGLLLQSFDLKNVPMKRLALLLLLLVGFGITACERHDFDETRRLHEAHDKH